MKYIKPYQIFEASATAPAALTAEQIEWLDKCLSRRKGSWKLNPQTGLIDVDGDFDCREQRLTDFKGVKFGKVRGDFDCEDNELTSLVGAPKTVSGDFRCYENELTTLVGAPQTVKGDFNCERNQLTSLEGAPQSVSFSFRCGDNQLTSLEGAPQSVGSYFNCSDNQLTTLEGAPKTVGRDFWCGDNPVTKSTLKAIFALMKKGKSYQQALEERWPKMGDVDRVLMYKEMPNLSPEETRKYKALATYANIKDYL